MKIAVVTMHAARNYGAVLQTYALQNYIEKNKNNVEIIDYRLHNQSFFGYLTNVNKKFKRNMFLKCLYIGKTFIPKIRTTILFQDFLKRKINLSDRVIFNSDGLINYPKADIYITGSDQVWNPRANNGFNQIYFLENAPGKKISYASSVGIDDLTSDEVQKLKVNLSTYDSISVREVSTIPILNKIGIDAKCVLDPTLLLTVDDWKNFCGEKYNCEPYVLVYFFGNSKSAMDVAKQIADSRGLRIVRIAVGFEKYNTDDIVERFITPEKFISLFLNSSYVITNSFHGTIFSINFKKQFLSYPTTEHNARFESVFNMFNLHDRNLRNINKENIINIQDIDYKIVSKELDVMRKVSYDYLQNNLILEV